MNKIILKNFLKRQNSKTIFYEEILERILFKKGFFFRGQNFLMSKFEIKKIFINFNFLVYWFKC